MDILLFNFHDVVLLMTIYQCLLFGLLLVVVRSEKKLSSLLLALFLLTQAAIPLDILITFGAGFRQWAIQTAPQLFNIFGFAYWLEGPVLLWYTRSLIYKDYRLKRQDLIFLLPLFGYGIYTYIEYFQYDSLTRLELLQNYNLYQETIWTHIVGQSRELLRFFFAIWCLVEIRNCRRQIRDSYSSIDKIDFNWLQLLVVGFLVIRGWAILVSVAIIFSAHLDTYVNFRAMGLASNYTVFVLVSAMIFFCLRNSALFEGLEIRTSGTSDKAAEKPQIDDGLVEKISEFMQREKPYLASALTLEQLSTQLGLPKRQLSNVINRHFECNFFEFINQYRIEEAKRLLVDPEFAEHTIMDVLLESGFNSKATFNNFFKKLTGTTPSDFRKSSLVAQASPV